MPHIRVNNCNLYYEDTGGNHPETIVFSHGLLWSGHMFNKQVEHLKQHYRVITYDHRGQGQSEVTPSGYDMDSLAEDAAAFITALNIAPCIFAGLSMGGFIGMRLAARKPALISKLILLETSALPEPVENLPRYNMLTNIVKLFGPGIVSGPVMKIMFGQSFLTDSNRKSECAYWKKQLQQNKRSIVHAVKGVTTRNGVENELGNIHCPTLIIVGDQDVATVPDKARYMRQHIEGSRLVIIPGAGHSSSIEEPRAVNEAISQFLGKH